LYIGSKNLIFHPPTVSNTKYVLMEWSDFNLSAEALDIHSKTFNEMLQKSNFLGPQENWKAVVARDAEVLKEYGITKEQIADRLETLVHKVFKAPEYNNPELIAIFPPHLNGTQNHYCKLIEDKFVISQAGTLGYHAFPFKRPSDRYFKYGSSDFIIYNLSNKKLIRFGDLLIELIRDQGFFEGSVAYRLEPKDVIQTLGLIPNTNYKPNFQKVTYWQHSMSSNRIDPSILTKYTFSQFDTISYNLTNGRLRILNPNKTTVNVMFQGYPVQLDSYFEYAEYELGTRHEFVS
jgi:hypothetical protein